MKKFLIILISFTLLIGISSCGRKKKEEVAEKKLPLVKTTKVEGKFFEENYKVIGVVKPYESAKLSSEEGGLITVLRKDKGDRVGRGEVVVRLKKDTDLAQLETAQAQYNLAKENYDRTERLYNEGVATEQQFTNAKLQLDVAEKSVATLQTRISKGYVVSPISGIVDAKFMNRGEMSSPGAPILSVVNVSSVKINCGVPERYAEKVKRGDKVKITFSILPDEEFEGTINFISPVINPQSRTFEIELVLGNSSGKLKPEMSANITFTNLSVDNAIVLPQDYIIDNGDEQFVFILEGDIAKKHVVKLGGRSDNQVLIESGLDIGEDLITTGFQGLNDGDKVTLVN